MSKKKERRNLTGTLQIRKEPEGTDSRKIEGYALVFNSESQDLEGFRERILPGALDGVLEKSDILALFNHDQSRGVLARSRRGKGTLELVVDDKGLLYRFEAPNTSLGDEVLEGVKRGDIAGSSFAFTVADEDWEKEEDGRYLRTIKRFGELFDVSPVIHPAYEATSVDTRGLDALKRSEEEDEEKDKEDDRDEDIDEEEETNSEDPDEDETEADSEDEDPEEDSDCSDDDPEENSDDEEEEEDSGDDSEDETEENKKRNRHNRKMKKNKFSMLGFIRSAVEGKAFDEGTRKVLAMGRKAMENSGAEIRGTYQIPTIVNKEMRYEGTPNGILASQNTEAEGYGGEAVPTELFDLVGPLGDRLIVAQLGARMLNLSGNVEIPLYSGANCGWESEIGTAKEGSGSFESIKMSPKRLTAEIVISKQFLFQTDPSAEALIRQNFVDCIAEKLQQTMFGDGNGSDTEPAGLFKGVQAEEADFTYGSAVEMEAELEAANVYGEYKYVASPSAKAILRQTNVDKGSGRFVMDNNEILGIPVSCTNSVVKKGLILGDWKNLYIANFGALDLTIDPLTLANKGQVKLVVNAWFDYKPVRPEAFVAKILK